MLCFSFIHVFALLHEGALNPAAHTSALGPMLNIHVRERCGSKGYAMNIPVAHVIASSGGPLCLRNLGTFRGPSPSEQLGPKEPKPRTRTVPRR